MLQDRRVFKLADLVKVQHDSPLYNEGSRRTLFYAQSWALVHYLLAGEPSRADLVTEYIKAIEAGAAADAAWSRIFGSERIEIGLRSTSNCSSSTSRLNR